METNKACHNLCNLFLNSSVFQYCVTQKNEKWKNRAVLPLACIHLSILSQWMNTATFTLSTCVLSRGFLRITFCTSLFSLNKRAVCKHLFALHLESCTCLHLFLLEHESSNWIVGNFQRNWA